MLHCCEAAIALQYDEASIFLAGDERFIINETISRKESINSLA